MYKKIFRAAPRVFPALIALLFCVSCANGSAGDAASTEAPSVSEAAVPETEAAVDTAAAHADGFVFESGGVQIYMDEAMADVRAKLGEPRRTFEAPSCAFNGIDRIFSYPGFDIYTYPQDGEDFVHTVYFTDDSVTTPEGVLLGSSMEDVTAAYGEDYETYQGQLTYAKGETLLDVLLEDGVVEAITYRLQVDALQNS